MNTISWMLVESSIRAFLIAGGVAAILAAMRVKPPAIRHAAWTGVLMVMLLLPVLVVSMPKVPVRLLPPQAAVAAPDFVMSLGDELPLRAVDKQPGPQISTPVISPRRWSWHAFAAAAYLLGVGALLARLIFGTLQTKRLIQRAIKSEGVLYTSACAAPVTVGLFRPKILLPAGWQTWPQEKLDCVLAHEREHMRRRDTLILWLSRLNRCLFWFHPLAWWLERRLAHLAEESCDEAVLAGGCDARQYAGFLVELARSVEQAGARVAVPGVAMYSSTLRVRVGRVLRGEPSAPVSRPRAVLIASLCGAVFIVLSACRIDRAQIPAPGQPTMNELMHRRAKGGKQADQQSLARIQEARTLSPAQVRALETKLRNSPQDLDTRSNLVWYYDWKRDVKGSSRHVLWAIEHNPASRLASRTMEPAVDREGYERGKRLWLAHVKKPGATAAVIDRAARFVASDDKPLAEQLLLAAQRTYPNDRGFSTSLGNLYYQVLVGSTGPLPMGVVRSVNLAAAHGAYAQQVREKLAQSNDPRLLTTAGSMLSAWGTNLYRSKHIDFDPFPLGKSYIERALSIQPDFQYAMAMRARLELMEDTREFQALLSGRRLEQAIKESSEADRLRLLAILIGRAYHGNKLDEAESHARELLKLAARFPKHRNYGNFLFNANMMLGKIALRRGDKRAAARHLLEASKTPGSAQLTYLSISMELPRALIDWGERGSVAEFLERCAKFNFQKKELMDWAAQIRRGINPDLIPYNSGCANGPC